MVYAGDKLHRSVKHDGLRVSGRIVSATLAQADGTPIKIKNRENAVSIKYPNVVSCKHVIWLFSCTIRLFVFTHGTFACAIAQMYKEYTNACISMRLQQCQMHIPVLSRSLI